MEIEEQKRMNELKDIHPFIKNLFDFLLNIFLYSKNKENFKHILNNRLGEILGEKISEEKIEELIKNWSTKKSILIKKNYKFTLRNKLSEKIENNENYEIEFNNLKNEFLNSEWATRNEIVEILKFVSIPKYFKIILKVVYVLLFKREDLNFFLNNEQDFDSMIDYVDKSISTDSLIFDMLKNPLNFKQFLKNFDIFGNNSQNMCYTHLQCQRIVEDALDYFEKKIELNNEKNRNSTDIFYKKKVIIILKKQQHFLKYFFYFF